MLDKEKEFARMEEMKGKLSELFDRQVKKDSFTSDKHASAQTAMAYAQLVQAQLALKLEKKPSP